MFLQSVNNKFLKKIIRQRLFLIVSIVVMLLSASASASDQTADLAQAEKWLNDIGTAMSECSARKYSELEPLGACQQWRLLSLYFDDGNILATLYLSQVFGPKSASSGLWADIGRKSGATALLMKLAEDNIEAQFQLSFCYSNGCCGFEKNDQEALRLADLVMKTDYRRGLYCKAQILEKTDPKEAERLLNEWFSSR